MKICLSVINSMLLWGAAIILPPTTSPGAINPLVTQENIQQTICVKNWTSAIRPSAYYTTKLKIQQMKALGISGRTSSYEEDHLISLELGGNPTDPKNLWPEPWKGSWNAHIKDRLENALHKRVCAGQMTLADAQHAMATNWIAEYKAIFP